MDLEQLETLEAETTAPHTEAEPSGETRGGTGETMRCAGERVRFGGGGGGEEQV